MGAGSRAAGGRGVTAAGRRTATAAQSRRATRAARTTSTAARRSSLRKIAQNAQPPQAQRLGFFQRLMQRVRQAAARIRSRRTNG
jgi:hypothetical protein